MARMVGGTFGVAIMGALVTTIGRAKIDSALPHLSASTRSTIANSLGGGGIQVHHTTPQILGAVRGAFVSALGVGLTIGAAVTLCGAIVAWALIQRTATAAEPELAAAEPIAEESVAEQDLFESAVA
jgi:hypothetical protein